MNLLRENRNKKDFWLLLGVLLGSFFIPVLVMTVVLWKGGYCPFGTKTLFLMDMKGQYLEFYTYLRYLLKGQGSLFYCWSRSLGGNFLGLFAYYVSSPLSFLTVLFPLEKMPEAICFLTLCKIGLAGMSFAWFASYLWRKENGDRGNKGSLFIMLFSCSYALLSYNIVYSLCLMWLDGVIFLPLVLYGAMRVLDGKSGLFYYVFLTMLFFCNYYTGYMVGVFTVIFVIFRILSQMQKNTWKIYGMAVGKFFLLSALAVGTAAPLLFPVVKDLMSGKLSNASYVPDTVHNFPLGKLLGKYQNGVYDSITNSGLPSIYCGYIILGCVVFYVLAKKIKWREKLLAVVVLAVLIGSFWTTKVDIFWHGMQYPNWFPYRYAFVFGFFFVYLGYMGFQNGIIPLYMESFPNETGEKKEVQQLDENSENHDRKSNHDGWYHSVGQKFLISNILILVLLIGVCVDLGSNASKMLQGLDREFCYGTRQEYEDFLHKTKLLTEDIEKNDAGLYRINQRFEYSKNDAMLLGYRGMTHYSSTYNLAVNQLTKQLGMAQAYFWNSGYGTTPLMDSLLSVKYVLADRAVSDWYSLRKNGWQASSYENKMCVPMLYGAAVTESSPDFSEDSFSNQNHYLNAVTGQQDKYFQPVSYTPQNTEDGWNYVLQAPGGKPLYLSMNFASSGMVEVSVNGTVVGNYFTNETNCNLYLGTFSEGEQVVVSCKGATTEQAGNAVIAALDMPLLQTRLQQLQQNGIQNVKSTGGTISGKITIAKGQKIMTSIPYDDGWTVKIDGKKVEKEKFDDTFLLLNAKEGTHTLEMHYVSPGFGTGMAVCIFSVFIAAMYFCFLKKRWFRRKSAA